MAKLSKKELKKGKEILGGVIVLCWVIAIIIGIGVFTFNIDQIMKDIYLGPFHFPMPSQQFSIVFLAIYVAEIVGIYMRKSFAIPLGRAVLVVTMVIFFPVGTIFGAILWKRINDPAAKKYLNYEESEEEEEEDEDEDKG